MELKWRIFYGFVVLLGNNLCSSKQITFYKNGTVSENNLKNSTPVAENEKLTNDIMKLILKRSSDESVTRLLLRALEDDAAYRAYTKRDHPITYLYHKTLKKIEGGPLSDEGGSEMDNRIRVAPMGLESPEQPDMSLAVAKLVDLNSLIENAAIRASTSDHSSIKQLKRFLCNNALSRNSKSVKVRPNRNKEKLTNLLKENNAETSRKKREIVKMLLTAYPMQVGWSEGGGPQHYLEKSNDVRFRPDQFISGISKDPSFSSSNNIPYKFIDSTSKQFQNYQNNKPLSKFNKNLSSSIQQFLYDNKLPSRLDEVSLKKGITSEDALEKIHQSAEDTVFKRVLNELISDIPNYVGLSTYKPIESADAMFKESNQLQHIESRVKSAKHTQENVASTTSKENYPCMKIRVKNGPVILTFQSESRESSTNIPLVDSPNVPIFKLLNDKLTNSVQTNITTASEPLPRNLEVKLTEDSGLGETSNDSIGKANVSSYFFGSDMDTDKSSYFDDTSFSIENKTKTLQDRATVFQSPDLINNSSDSMINTMVNKPHFFREANNYSQEKPQLSNGTEPLYKGFSNNAAQGMLFDVKNYVPSERFQPRKSVSVACPVRTDSFILPDIKVQRYGVPRNLFLTRNGSNYYKLTHSPYYYRFGSNCSHCGGESYWRYVPKVYYNDLVVSKGLVGQHPSREEPSGAMLSDSTLKKMEMLNILKFYLDSLSPERNYTYNRSKDPSSFNPMLNHNRKYFIKM